VHAHVVADLSGTGARIKAPRLVTGKDFTIIYGQYSDQGLLDTSKAVF